MEVYQQVREEKGVEMGNSSERLVVNPRYQDWLAAAGVRDLSSLVHCPALRVVKVKKDRAIQALKIHRGSDEISFFLKTHTQGRDSVHRGRKEWENIHRVRQLGILTPNAVAFC